MPNNRISLDDIADWNNLSLALVKALRKKRRRRDVVEFVETADANLAAMRAGILDGTIEVGVASEFQITDPKPRTIHAPCFGERVLHHAIMNHLGPILERGLVDDSYACRIGKGTIAAVHRAQQHIRRFPWYAKMDVKGYFASIDHAILKSKLRRRLRSKPLLSLLDRIIDSHGKTPGSGLPIGSLLSQSFANFYLNSFDRFLLEIMHVDGLVRYMDDVLIWSSSRDRITATIKHAHDFLQAELRLTLKDSLQINRSSKGVTVCGYRVHAGTILLAKSRQLRFRVARRSWEREFREGRINELELQRGIDSALSIIAHAQSRTWRKRQFPAAAPPGALPWVD